MTQKPRRQRFVVVILKCLYQISYESMLKMENDEGLGHFHMIWFDPLKSASYPGWSYMELCITKHFNRQQAFTDWILNQPLHQALFCLIYFLCSASYQIHMVFRPTGYFWLHFSYSILSGLCPSPCVLRKILSWVGILTICFIFLLTYCYLDKNLFFGADWRKNKGIKVYQTGVLEVQPAASSNSNWCKQYGDFFTLIIKVQK